MGFKDLKDLTIMDDFMFGRVMRKEPLVRELLERILNVKIDHIEEVNWQETVKDDYLGKGIRMDVYAQDGRGTAYDVEVQVTSQRDLAKRARYYHSMIDRKLLDSGEDYENLKDAYVIFICPYDPVGAERYLYTFRQVCMEHVTCALNDGATTVFVNTRGNVGILSDELKALIEYMRDGTVTDRYTSELDAEVKKTRQDREVRDAYMSLAVRMMDERREGRAEGRAEGRVEGRAEGRVEGREEERQSMLKRTYRFLLRMFGPGRAQEALRTEFDATPEEIAALQDEGAEG